MSTLELSLANHDFGPDVVRGVVARIYGFSEGKSPTSEVEPTLREVVIPVSRDGSLSVDVTPGRYRVQVVLPTGEILQKSATTKEGESVSLVFEPSEAPGRSTWEKNDAAERPTASEKHLSWWFDKSYAGKTINLSKDDKEPLIVHVYDPFRLRTTLQACRAAVLKAKPTLLELPGMHLSNRYSELYALKHTVVELGNMLELQGDAPLVPRLNEAYPKLRHAFRTFDTAVVNLSDDRPWRRPRKFAQTLWTATEPLRDALEIDEDPNVWEILGDQAPPAVLSVLGQPNLVSGDSAWRSFWHGTDGDKVASTLSLTPIGRNSAPLPPKYRQGRRRLWVLSDQNEARDAASRRRQWFVLRAHDTVDFACVPLPWFDPKTQRFVDAEVRADDVSDSPGSPLQLILRDPTLGGLLAYLGHGNFSVARTMLDTLDHEGLIEQTIRDKVQNPLAACAAAYFGLAIFEPAERERWDHWLPNIMNQFPWLPDGAIVHARRILQRPRHTGEQAQALAALKLAYHRGVPYFSAGIQHMRDMLSLFAAKDQDAHQMLEAVSGVLSRVDGYQAFTVIRFPKVNSKPE